MILALIHSRVIVLVSSTVRLTQKCITDRATFAANVRQPRELSAEEDKDEAGVTQAYAARYSH